MQKFYILDKNSLKNYELKDKIIKWNKKLVTNLVQ